MEIRQFAQNKDKRALKNDYAKFIVKEEHSDGSTSHVFEFSNDVIGKEVQLAGTTFDKFRHVVLCFR